MKSSRRQKFLNPFSCLLLFAFIFINAFSAFAGPGKTTYQAKIVKPDGYPLEVTSVNFKFTILDPAGSCILYSETYSSVNMSSTGGLISFALGSGVKTYPASATTFEQVFSNITPSLSCDTGGPANYSPAASDIRKIVMQFHDGSGWQTLPAMSINAVPYAMYANEATKLNGLTSSDFVQLSTVPTCATSEALRYTGTGFSCVAVGNSVTSGTVITALGYTPADGASVTTLTSNISSVSSTVFSVSSTVTSLQNSVAASFAAITSSQWTTSGANIFYNTGNVGIGTTTPVTKLDVSGGVRIGAESTTCAPALAGTLRYNASNVEYCNGTSWQAFGVSGAGLQSFNGSTSGTQSFATGIGGTAPNFNTSNGVHTLNIPLALTGSVTAGLISNADYTTFTNKITSSAASIAQVLGYVPADNAASGTYAQKANNLSDLTNIATARTNLGLGAFATANTVDLGSASATGTLAIARLPNFTGDATIAAASNTIILSNSGVTAGTYTKVTVDAKGRVTSSSALASSDVTTALGYTPANSATIVSSQWTTSGTNISYNTGNVGIGTSSPSAKFEVSGTSNFLDNVTIAAGRKLGIGVGPGSYSLKTDIGEFTTSVYTSQVLSLSGGLNFGSNGAGDKMVLDAIGNVGIGTTTPVTKLDVSGGVRISMESATCAASFAGTLRYNTGNVEYCNGTSWQAFGVSGAGLQSFNGSTSGTQTLATGTGGTAPNVVTVNGVHTLNIPLASTGSVTAGLISNSDYTTFTNKITSNAASIAQVLGYVPADNAVSGTYAQKANNLSDLTNVATARANLGLGTFATASSIDLGSTSATGTLAVARLPAFTGDATIAAASNTIILSNSGVTAGTYTKVTVDGKGRVTSGAQITSTDVTTALGYTPANSATTVSSQWSTSGTTINYMNGNVGIGTTGPQSKLQINTSFNEVNKPSGLEMFINGGSTNADAGKLMISPDGNMAVGGLMYINHQTAPSDRTVLNLGTTGFSGIPATMSLSNGNVGIGTTSPSDKLTLDTGNQRLSDGYGFRWGDSSVGIYGNGTNETFSLYTNATQRLIVDSSGNVGIGVTNPSAKLELASGTASLAPLKFASGTLLSSAQSGSFEYDGFNFYVTDGTNTRRAIAANANPGTYDNVSNINSSSNITLTPTTGSVVVSSTTASTNSSTGALVVKGGLGVAGDIYTSGTIVTSSNIQGVSVTATSGMISPYIYGSTLASGNLTLESTTNAIKGNVLIASQGGNVGIGTSSPTYKLDVAGDIGLKTNATYIYGKDTLGNNTRMLGMNSSNVLYVGDIDSRAAGVNVIATASDLNLIAQSANNVLINTSGTERMRVTAAGNVGIGTTSPAAPLDVKQTTLLGGTANNNVLVARFESPGGSGGNNVFHNEWRVRSSAGTDWLTHKIHDAISVDASYLTPGTDTRTFWERDPQNDIQSWGTGASAYMTIKAGNVGIGTTSPVSKLEVSGGGLAVTGWSNNNSGSNGGLELGWDGAQTVLQSYNRSGGAYTPQFYSASKHIFANGNVGIGMVAADNPASNIAVKGNAAIGASYITTAAPTNGLIVEGNVGIGTTAPAAKLHVAGSAQIDGEMSFGDYRAYLTDYTGGVQNKWRYFGTSTSNNGHIRVQGVLGGHDLATAQEGQMFIDLGFNARSGFKVYGSIYGKVSVSNGNAIRVYRSADSLTFYYYIYYGSYTQYSLNVFGSGAGDVTSSQTATTVDPVSLGYTLVWNSADHVNNNGIAYFSGSTSSASSVMMVSDSGNVGIGTSSPVSNLEVGSASQTYLRISTTASNTAAELAFTNSGAADWVIGADGPNRNIINNGAFHFWKSGYGTAMLLDDNGNVGIGTTSPASKLDVNGLVISSGFSFNGSEVGADTGLFEANDGLLQLKSNGAVVLHTTRGDNEGGYVGIGTTSPTEKLHVQGNSKVGDTASTGTVYMQLLGMHDTAGGSGFRLQFDRTNDIFGIAREWSGFQSPSFVIKRSDGNVGIGTTSPSTALEVSGTVKATAFSGPGILLQSINLAAADFVSHTTSVWLDVPNLSSTFTTAVPTTVDIVASGMYRTMNASVGNVRLVINGTEVAGDYIQQAPSSGTFHTNTSINWAQTLAAGTHTIKVQWRNENATGSFDQGWNDSGRVLSRRLKIMVYSQ